MSGSTPCLYILYMSVYIVRGENLNFSYHKTTTCSRVRGDYLVARLTHVHMKHVTKPLSASVRGEKNGRDLVAKVNVKT